MLLRWRLSQRRHAKYLGRECTACGKKALFAPSSISTRLVLWLRRSDPIEVFRGLIGKRRTKLG